MHYQVSNQSIYIVSFETENMLIIHAHTNSSQLNVYFLFVFLASMAYRIAYATNYMMMRRIKNFV